MTDNSAAPLEESDDATGDAGQKIQEPRLWCDDGWTARIMKNDDDDGWAVAMIKDGEREPALIGPWTMGRDKKNPKPLDPSAFITLVKTATEFVRRHEQQLHAMLHKTIVVSDGAATISVTLDIIPDDDFPYAVLTAHDEDREQLAQVKVAATFKLSQSSASTWVANEFRKPN
ncbi:MAG: hypothetical protein ABI171_02365 [Collimonas sp.]|uniref:hypothetical protein n=1 Tax=Collimonas sp. TaxID=1963772 RepID=UPI0032633679